MSDNKDIKQSSVLDMPPEAFKRYMMMTGKTREQIEQEVAANFAMDKDVGLEPLEGANPELEEKFTMPI